MRRTRRLLTESAPGVAALCAAVAMLLAILQN
jgi:hypothetical protein